MKHFKKPGLAHVPTVDHGAGDMVDARLTPGHKQAGLIEHQVPTIEKPSRNPGPDNLPDGQPENQNYGKKNNG